MAAAKQPANVPLLLGDDHALHQAWAAFFDSLTAQLVALQGAGPALVAASSYANDAAAAAGGVAVGSYYRSGSQVMIRVV